MTARRAEHDMDREALISLYGRELGQYPGDVVESAIRGYRGKFFPTFEELRTVIERDRRLVERRLRIRALADYVSNGFQNPKTGMTPEQRQMASERLRERAAELRKADTVTVQNSKMRDLDAAYRARFTNNGPAPREALPEMTPELAKMLDGLPKLPNRHVKLMENLTGYSPRNTFCQAVENLPPAFKS
jgi:hypothetical protein